MNSDYNNPFENSKKNRRKEKKKLKVYVNNNSAAKTSREKSSEVKYKHKTNVNNNEQKQTSSYDDVKTSERTIALDRKSRFKKRYIALILIGLVIYGNWWQVEYAFDNFMTERFYQKLEADSSYTFAAEDFDLQDEKVQAALNQDVGTGQEVNITDGLKLVEEREYETIYKRELYAGSDIEPGVYTIEITGDVSLLENNLGLDFYEENTYYNIPITETTVIKINQYVDKDEDSDQQFEVNFKPQDAYVDFENKKSGLFISGKAVGDSEIAQKEDYYHFETHYQTEEKADYMYRFDKELEVKNAPGVYYIAEYHNRD